MLGRAATAGVALAAFLFLATPAAAQPPVPDGAFFLEWLTPETAKSGTLPINATGEGNATLRVGFQPPTRTSSCIGGAFVRIPVRYDLAAIPGHARLDPGDVSLPADHVPNSAGAPATRWSGPITFATSWYVNETTPNQTIAFKFSTGTPTVSGGSCTPTALTRVVPGASTLSVVLPGPGDAAPPPSETEPAPALGLVVALAAIVLAAARFR